MAAPVSVLATLSAVTLGVVNSHDASQSRDHLASSWIAGDLGSITERSGVVSRNRSRLDDKAKQAKQQKQSKQAKQAKQAKRAAQADQAVLRDRQVTARVVAQADTAMWTTEALNLWNAPQESAQKTGIVDSGQKVLVTGREQLGRVEIVISGASRWVTTGYLDSERPLAGIDGNCSNGTSVPSGVDPSITKVHQAVCARFPQITSYGTFRNDGEHGQGRAVDVMVSGALGWEIADYLRANYVALGIEYLIYSQKIWSVERAGEGWRAMSDRGSTTANHYDHVHVTVY